MYEYIEDVESDMSVFHRIDDVRQMVAQTFIDRAIRLSAYRGVIRARAEEEHNRTTDQGTVSYGGNGNRTVSSDAATLESDPSFGGMFEVRKYEGEMP